MTEHQKLLIELIKKCYKAAGQHENRGNLEDADIMYAEAIDICEELAETDRYKFADVQLDMYEKYSRFCEFSGNFRNAESSFEKRIELLELLVKRDAEKYESRLMKAYGAYANYLGVCAEKKQEGVEFYLLATRIALRLVDSDPVVYNAWLAYYHMFMYIFSKEKAYSDKAVEYARLSPENQKSKLVFSYFAIDG